MKHLRNKIMIIVILALTLTFPVFAAGIDSFEDYTYELKVFNNRYIRVEPLWDEICTPTWNEDANTWELRWGFVITATEDIELRNFDTYFASRDENFGYFYAHKYSMDRDQFKGYMNYDMDLKKGESIVLRFGINADSEIEHIDFKMWGNGSGGTAIGNARIYIDKSLYYQYEKNPGSVDVTQYLSTNLEEPLVTVKDNESPYDFNTIRANADFEVEVYPNVSWVPLNSLGKPDLTLDEMKEFIEVATFEELQDEINTIYEVVMYLAASEFKASVRGQIGENFRVDGVVDSYNGSWEVGTPVELALQSNVGNCNSISDMLVYFLQDDYEDVGYLWHSNLDGSGHVFCYIYEEGVYNIIDLTHYRVDFWETAIESGNKSDYFNSDYIAGNMHRTKSLESYFEYCRENYNELPVLFSSFSSADIGYYFPEVFSKFEELGVSLYVNREYKEAMNIIFDDKDSDYVTYKFTRNKVVYPNAFQESIEKAKKGNQ